MGPEGKNLRREGKLANGGVFPRYFVVRGPIITSALKLPSPDPSSFSSSTFNRILLPATLGQLNCNGSLGKRAEAGKRRDGSF